MKKIYNEVSSHLQSSYFRPYNKDISSHGIFTMKLFRPSFLCRCWSLQHILKKQCMNLLKSIIVCDLLKYFTTLKTTVFL